MWLFYFLFWTAVRARGEPPYRKIGDKAVLIPDSVVNPITSIEWKHGADLAMEWYGGETFSYRQFEDRGSLNISTGALTITGLTPDDSGNYTVEINNKVTSKTQLLVISPVSKPTLSLWCEPEMTYCFFTCNGNTTGAEPVTYKWTLGDTTLSSNKEHNITKENKEPWFSCAFQNPVSFNSSEKVFNPFIKDLTWIYIVIAVFTVVICIIIIIYFRHKGIINFRCKWIKRETVDGTKEETTGMLTSVEKTSTQDLESPDTSNETERPASLVVVQETSPQDTTSTGPPETSKETGKAANGTVREMSEMPTPVEKTSTQDLESPDTSNETERPASLVEESSSQDKTSTGPPETSKETERSTTSPDVPETSTQDPTSVVTQDTSNGTERPASLIVVQETSPQDTTSTGPPETSKETERSTTSPDVPETSTQDQETAESPDPSNETEMSVLPPPLQNTSTQDLETAESPDTSNETERPASPVVVQETSSQDTTSTGPLETSNETERSPTSPDVPETSTQDQETAESPDPSNETEMSVLLPPVKDTSTQDPTSVVTQNTSNGTVNSTISEVNETSTQDQETAESPDTSNETERPASPVVVQETSPQDTTSTGPPETSKETERSATSPDVPETSIQDQKTAESPDPSNETETKDQRKPCRNYNEGGCRKGDSCHYRHVCEFALKGNCPNGSNCRLKHPGVTKPQWQFEGDSGTWYEFIYKRGTTECSVNSDEIERKYQKNPNSKMPFTVNRNYYELDFEAKIQINLMTKTRRRVRRVLL